MWTFIHKLGSPKHCYRIAGYFIPYLGTISIVCFIYGLVGGLILAPADYQQGDGFRIIYVHVPSAFLSLSVYMVMALSATVSLIWRIKMADVITKVSAPLGATFTFLALVTGSLWGKPMWGTYWVWDARLTSELILLFLYVGYMALESALEDRHMAARASNILVLVGVVNIPIIHYSVVWWNTLHQGASISLLNKPTIAPSMLYPLLAMLVAFMAFFFAVMLMRARCEILLREQKSNWVKELVQTT